MCLVIYSLSKATQKITQNSTDIIHPVILLPRNFILPSVDLVQLVLRGTGFPIKDDKVDISIISPSQLSLSIPGKSLNFENMRHFWETLYIIHCI